MPEDSSLLNKVVNYLKLEHIQNESPREHSDREQAWLELLENDCLTHILNSEQLKMALNAKCYRVAEYLYEKYRDYGEILSCYIRDQSRHMEMWSYIHKHALIVDRKCYQQIHDNFEKLLEINCEEITKIVIDYFPTNINQLIRSLDGTEMLLYMFLGELIKQHVTIETNDCETYLNNLCKFNPENVDSFLRTNDNYRLENALDIVKKYQLCSSCIYLYERQGDYESGFNLSLELLKEAPESTAECRALEVSGLCSRASQALGDSEKEEMWFAFLKMILPRPDLTQITKNILNSASAHVNLTKLVELVLNFNTSSGNFGDIKHLLLGMLSNSRYETLLLQTTAKILGHDLHNLLAKERQSACQGLAVKSIKCILCRLQLYGGASDILVFGSCGHAAHDQCIETNLLAKNNDGSSSQLQCPRCGISVSENEPIHLAKPKWDIFPNNIKQLNSISGSSVDDFTGVLQLEAPPRLGIGGI